MFQKNKCQGKWFSKLHFTFCPRYIFQYIVSCFIAFTRIHNSKRSYYQVNIHLKTSTAIRKYIYFFKIKYKSFKCKFVVFVFKSSIWLHSKFIVIKRNLTKTDTPFYYSLYIDKRPFRTLSFDPSICLTFPHLSRCLVKGAPELFPS